MRASLLLAALAGAVGVVAPTTCLAGSPEPALDAALARHATRTGTVVVLSRADGPTAALCVRSPTARALPDDVRELERRGVEVTWTTPHVGTRLCMRAPRAELPLLLWAAGRWLPPSVVEAGTGGPDDAPSPPDDGATGAEHAAALSLSRVRALALLDGERDAPTGAQAAVVAVVSPLPLEDATALASTALGPLGPAPSPLAERRAPRQTHPRFAVLESPALSAPFVRDAWVLPPLRAAGAHAALAVAVELLSGGERGRLPRLVAKRSFARRAGLWTEEVPGATLVGFWLELSTRIGPDRARPFVDGAALRVGATPAGPLELARAKQRTLVAALEAWEAPLTRARALADAEAAGLGAEVVPERLRAIPSVTALGVMRALRAALPPERRTTIEVYPPGWAMDAP